MIMRRLWLTPELAQLIAQHGLEDYPHEACGLIGGVNEQALSVSRIKNISDKPEHAFLMDGAEFTKTMFEFSKRGEVLIGIYHTHPHGDHLPSRTDVQEAQYPDTAYVVVGLKQRQPRLSAWQIRNGLAEPIDIIVSETEPPPALAPMSRAQVRANIIALVFSFIFLIVLALSLLPPAPPIPTR